MAVRSANEIKDAVEQAMATDINVVKNDRAIPVDDVLVECSECGDKFDTDGAFKQHNQLKHELHECDECDAILIGNGIHLHKMSHKTKTCEFCGEEKNANGFWAHVKYCPSRIALGRDGKKECDICNEWFDPRGFATHVKSHSPKPEPEVQTEDNDDVIQKAANLLFGDIIPIKFYGSISAWAEMTTDLLNEMKEG